MDGFKRGSGCYKCSICGKLTRLVKDQSSQDMCFDCEERSMHENSHSDNNYKNDICDWGDKCPIKHYTDKQRWWLH